jgi:hypothetical protein
MHNYLRLIALACACLPGCLPPSDGADSLPRPADIYPRYEEAVIPYNIAPLNFAIREGARAYRIWFVAGADSFGLSSRGRVDIPLAKWRRLLSAHRGDTLSVRILALASGGWGRYPDMRFAIAPEAIDPYVVYRLIEPGYVTWGKMGLYQRCLEDFDEQPVLTNELVGNACINCHSFRRNDPETMLFHVRKTFPGTLFLQDGELRRVDTQGPGMISAGVYPRWHPSGRYVAFSANTTRQNFHAGNPAKIEVYDMASDIVVYDTEKNRVITTPGLSSATRFETFPEWSPDGRYLYYCSAPALPMPSRYDSLRYDLLRISFDEATERFGSRPDTLAPASLTQGSAALARVSPDNRFVVFCLSDFGTFPIWHRDNDLYLLDLSDGTIRPLHEINSSESDSYHAWSSNGRWLVFGSRRMDGSYTRPYICYFRPDGTAAAPFLLPQKNPDYYDLSLKSFNIPEFITGRISVSPARLAEAVRHETARKAQ